MADRRRLGLAAAACTLALVILGLVLRHHTLPGDRRLFVHWSGRYAGERVGQLADFFGNVGLDVVAAPTVVLAALVLAKNVGPRSALLVAAAGAVGVVNAAIKPVFSPTQLGAQTLGPGTNTFPSGHVAYATAFFGSLAVLGHAHRRPEVSVICVGLVVGMAPARILVGAHLPSDALGGYLAGAAWLAGLLALLGPRALRS